MPGLVNSIHETWNMAAVGILHNAGAWIIPAVGEQVADFLMNVKSPPDRLAELSAAFFPLQKTGHGHQSISCNRTSNLAGLRVCPCIA